VTTADLAIVGGDVVTDRVAPATVLVGGGRILALQAPELPVVARRVLDATGMLVLPGAIDVHFHCRDPLATHRGDFASETRAAAAGGVTTVFEMPISKPATATLERWRARCAIAAAKAYVNVGLYAAPGFLDGADLKALADAGVVGFKLFTTRAVVGREDEFEGLATQSAAHVLQALELVRDLGRPFVLHAEDQDLIDLYRTRAAAHEGPAFRRHQASRPAVVEATAIASLAQMALATGCQVHIAHVSSAAGAEAVRQAKRSGAPLTAETCPHYLFCTDDDLERAGTFGVINPPLRFAADRDALWAALADGTIDLIATDHAPFTRAEKEAATDFLHAPPGHPGLEALLPLLMTAAAQGRLSVEDVVALVSRRPAARFGLLPHKGTLAPGADADVTIYDPRGTRTLRRGQGESRATDSDVLYEGTEVQGHVHATLVNGHVVYEGGRVVGTPGLGGIVRPGHSTVHQGVPA
jgi:dihydropyrimidinase/dihydroorotase/allantoinase